MKQAIAHGDRNVVVCQIESVAAVENAERIAAVPGVGALFVGRADLALSMGLDNSQDPRVLEATEAVLRATLAAGKTVGMFVGSNADRDKYRALGVRWSVQRSHQTLLRQGAQPTARPVPSKETA